MTKLELNRLIADKVLGMEICKHWRAVNYNQRRSIFGDTVMENSGPMLLRDPTRCPHLSGKCYPTLEIRTSFGVVGGVPQYCGRAALTLLREIQDRADVVTLQRSNDKWTLTMIDIVDEDGNQTPELVAQPVPASTPEMAVALAAAGLAGVSLAESDITE